MSLLHPWALLLLLPLGWIFLRLLRRQGSDRVRWAPLWPLDAERPSVGGGGRLRWGDPLPWCVLAAGLLWMLALAAPERTSPSAPGASLLLLLDAGLPEGDEAARTRVERLVAREPRVEIHAAGRRPSGPFATLEELDAASVDPTAPTLGELLGRLAPGADRPVEILHWGQGPTGRGRWRSRSYDPGARLWNALRDGRGGVWICASPEAAGEILRVVGGETLRLDAQARAVATDPFPDRPLRVQLEGARSPLDLPALRPTRVWLVDEAGSAWGRAVELWPEIDLRRVERSGLPAAASDWSQWRDRRGGGNEADELLVVVGQAAPAWPLRMPWLWLDPRPGRAPGLVLRDGEAIPPPVGATVEGVELRRLAPACGEVAAAAPWAVEAGGRLIRRPDAAVLNLGEPWTDQGGASALLALRLRSELCPVPPSFAGTAMPSPAFDWPARRGDRPILGGTRRWGGRGLAIAAWLLSLFPLARAPWPRPWRGALALLLLLAGVASSWIARPGDLILVLDASPSCRAALPGPVMESVGRAAERSGQRLGIALLDGEDGRWLLPPASPSSWPFAPEEFEALLLQELDALASPSATRLAGALGPLLTGVELRAPRLRLFTDGHLEESASVLRALRPDARWEVIAVAAGREDDGLVMELRRSEGDPAAGGRVVVRHRPPPGGGWLVLDLDGHELARRRVDEPGVELFPLPPPSGGAHRLTARVEGRADPWPENDRAALQWSDAGDPRVRWIGPGGHRPEGLGSAVRPQVIVLDAVDPDEIAQREPELLRALEEGRGLLVLAGPGSWLLEGRSGERELERWLPVELKVGERRRRPAGTWVILLDASGSMSTVEGGVSRFERSLFALAASLESLGEDEALGLVVFAERVLATMPPHPQPEREELEALLRGVQPDGGTYLGDALAEGARLLRGREGPGRLLLLSDGITRGEDVEAWRGALGDAELSVLEIGDAASPPVRRLAQLSGGRYRLLQRFGDVGDLLVEQLRSTPRERLVEGPAPLIDRGGWGPRMPDVVERYAALRPRQQGRVEWVAGELEDPILTLGESGTARVAVLATTPGTPWAPDSDRWGEVVGELLRWLARAEEPELRLSATEPRRLLDPSLALPFLGEAPRLRAVGGHEVELEPLRPGWWRARGSWPEGAQRVVDAGGRTIALLDLPDPAREWRVWGTNEAGLARLPSSSPMPEAGGASPPAALLLCCLLWLAVGVGLSRAGRLPLEEGDA